MRCVGAGTVIGEPTGAGHLIVGQSKAWPYRAIHRLGPVAGPAIDEAITPARVSVELS